VLPGALKTSGVRGGGNCLFYTIEQILSEKPSVAYQRKVISENWTDEHHDAHVEVADGGGSAAAA
jgi:hypothetical protein